MKQKITKTVVDALLPGQIVSDAQLDGFRVRAGSTAKVYSVQKRVGRKVLTRTIGRHGVFTPDQARDRAKRFLLELAIGVDPLDAKKKIVQKQEITFRRLFDLYMERPTLKESTKSEIRAKIGKHLADWMDTPATDITRQMVLTRHRALVAIGPTQAALIARYARAIFNFGIDYFRDQNTGESIVARNPVDVIRGGEMPTPRRRDTLIDRAAIRPWFQAWRQVRKDNRTACDCMLTTLFLGCRRSEAMGLRWEDVNLGDKTVRFRDTKNKTDHVMPTGDYLTRLLRERLASSRVQKKRKKKCEGATKDPVYVFPARSGSGHLADPRKAMDKIAAISGIRFILSDLRRTFASHAKALGIDYFDVQRLLNHKVRANEATPGYIVMAIERRRELVQRIEDFLLKAGGLKEAQVISLALATTEKAA